MPILIQVDDKLPENKTQYNFVIPKTTSYQHSEEELITQKLKNCDIQDVIDFVKSADEKLCYFKTKDEETALSMAIYRGSHTLCEELIKKGCNVLEVASFPPFQIKMSPLSYAVSQKYTEIVKLLLGHGCDPTASDEYGRSAVQCAICSGNSDILQLFLDHGCDPNSRIVETTFTLLHEACYRDGEQSVMKLLKAGADPNLYEFHDRAIPAFQTYKLSIHKLLCEHGSEINWRTCSGETILHNAVTLGHTDLVEFLLQNGAIMNFTQTVIMYGRDNMASYIQEKNLMDLAIKEQQYQICLLLIQYGYQISQSLHVNYQKLFNSSCSNTKLLHRIVSDDIYHNFEMATVNSNFLKIRVLESNDHHDVSKLTSLCRTVIRSNLAKSFPQTSYYYKLKKLKTIPSKLINDIMYK